MTKYDLNFVNTILKEHLDNRLMIIEEEEKFYLKRIDTDERIEIPEEAVKTIDINFSGNASLAILHFLYELKVPYFQVYKSSRSNTYYESTDTEHETFIDDKLRVIEGKVFTYRTYRKRGIPEIYRVSYTTYERDETYVVFIPLIPAVVETECYYEKTIRTGRKIRSEKKKLLYHRKWDGRKLVEDRYEELPTEVNED